MSERLQEALELYENKFDDGFPTIPFDGMNDDEIIRIIDECVETGKDVYTLGYLDIDDKIY